MRLCNESAKACQDVRRQLDEERKRSGRYFERMKRVEGNLSLIRQELGIPGRQMAATISHIRGLQETVTRLIEERIKSWADEAHKKMFDKKNYEKVTLSARVRQDLMDLAEGCRKHPGYRQWQVPRVECFTCEALWLIRRRYPR